MTSSAGSFDDAVADKVKAEVNEPAADAPEYTLNAEPSYVDAINHSTGDVMPGPICTDGWEQNDFMNTQAQSDVTTQQANDSWAYEDAVASQARNEWQAYSDTQSQACVDERACGDVIHSETTQNDCHQPMPSVKTEAAAISDPTSDAGQCLAVNCSVPNCALH